MKMKFSTGVITLLAASASLLLLSSSTVDGQSVKIRTCTKEVPCEECTGGDCRSDVDCVGDLVCFHQYGRGNEGDRVSIPGCNVIGTYIE